MIYPKYNEKVDRMHEFISYDGCDEFGPQSKLYDLYVWYKKSDLCYIDHWHTEDWYEPNKDVKYQRIAVHHVNPEIYQKTIVNRSSSDSFLLHLP